MIGSLTRCPFRAIGVSRDAMPACPGYSNESIAVVAGRPTSAATTTCGHLAAHQLAPGRYVPSCQHPEAAWVTEAARVLLEGDALRQTE